jgi:hypothetical protein
MELVEFAAQRIGKSKALYYKSRQPWHSRFTKKTIVMFYLCIRDIIFSVNKSLKSI